MSKQELREYMVETYFTLRITIAASAILLPLVLLAWAAIDDRVDMQGSISAFYYTSARNAFVGIVIAMGIALIAYHGYDAEEDWALNVAGVLAVLVALFPGRIRTRPNSTRSGSSMAFPRYRSSQFWLSASTGMPARLSG